MLVGLTPGPVAITNGTVFSIRGNAVRGHYGSSPDHVEQLIRLVASGRLDLGPSISGHVPLADAAGAVEALEHKKGDPVRLVLTP